MIQYMKVQELAFSTIELYSRVFEKIQGDVSTFELRGNSFWIEYISKIIDPINRNNYRSVILKVCRDVLGEKIFLPLVKRPIRLQPVYTIEEVSRIFSKITNVKHLAIARLMFTEGMRVGEVLSIRLSDYLKKEGAVIIRDTKNGNDYKKYLDASTIESLREYLMWAKTREMPKVLLFEGWGNEKYSQTSVRNFMEKATLLAGVDVKGSCHIFRRSSSVWKCESGWSVEQLAASINNSPRTAQRYYAQVRPEYLRTLAKPVIPLQNISL